MMPTVNNIVMGWTAHNGSEIFAPEGSPNTVTWSKSLGGRLLHVTVPATATLFTMREHGTRMLDAFFAVGPTLLHPNLRQSLLNYVNAFAPSARRPQLRVGVELNGVCYSPPAGFFGAEVGRTVTVAAENVTVSVDGRTIGQTTDVLVADDVSGMVIDGRVIDEPAAMAIEEAISEDAPREAEEVAVLRWSIHIPTRGHWRGDIVNISLLNAYPDADPVAVRDRVKRWLNQALVDINHAAGWLTLRQYVHIMGAIHNTLPTYLVVNPDGLEGDLMVPNPTRQYTLTPMLTTPQWNNGDSWEGSGEQDVTEMIDPGAVIRAWQERIDAGLGLAGSSEDGSVPSPESPSVAVNSRPVPYLMDGRT